MIVPTLTLQLRKRKQAGDAAGLGGSAPATTSIGIVAYVLWGYLGMGRIPISRLVTDLSYSTRAL